MTRRDAKSRFTSASTVANEVAVAMTWLKENRSEATRSGMARFGLPSVKALGVPMGSIQKLGRQLGRNQTLPIALWATDCYEARLLAAYVGEPDKLTSAQMESWCRDFDNWAVCDTLCFALFDRSPRAWSKVEHWTQQKEEFVKRAGFALLASLALHDRKASDASFSACWPLIEHGAQDERNFVKKAVLWALRAVGGRNASLHAAALGWAYALIKKEESTPRWIGRSALRELQSPATLRRLAAKSARKKSRNAETRR